MPDLTNESMSRSAARLQNKGKFVRNPLLGSDTEQEESMLDPTNATKPRGEARLHNRMHFVPDPLLGSAAEHGDAAVTARSRNLLLFSAILLILAAAGFVLFGSAFAGGRVQSSSQPTYWWWDREHPVGESTLARANNKLQATYSADNLTPGHVITLWMIIFNNPDACASSPCQAPEDVFNAETRADFYPAGGVIVGKNGRVTITGRLHEGHLIGSGMVEVGEPALASALEDARRAEVHLALHDHFEAQTGDVLEAQLSTFLGGCDPEKLNFASGPQDLPDEEGECSTFQLSIHPPQRE